jgi:protein-S-isoprenylcysteine O-methyltransferase Ste14
VSIDLRKLRLRAVWLLVVPFVLLARPTPKLLALGALVAALGVALRGWAAGLIRKDRELSTSGPYAHTRNPLYLGSFLIGLGAVLAGGRWELLLLFGVFYALVYGAAIRAEARALEERFGDRYVRWARAVPVFFPRVGAYREATAEEAGARFTFERWRRNREYEALLGALAGFAFLTAKLLLDR